MEEYKVEIRDGKAILKKRLKFLCWKCGQEYSIFKEADLKQRLFITCPFCKAKASVDFGVTNVKEVLRTHNAGADDGVVFAKFDLPSVLKTNKLDK